MTENPLLSDWNTPHALPPFGAISDGDFAPALEIAMAEHLKEIGRIADNAEPPDFENTIVALEGAGEPLDRVLSVFFNVAGADSNDTRQALQREFSPKLAKHSAASLPTIDSSRGLPISGRGGTVSAFRTRSGAFSTSRIAASSGPGRR